MNVVLSASIKSPSFSRIGQAHLQVLSYKFYDLAHAGPLMLPDRSYIEKKGHKDWWGGDSNFGQTL